MRPLKNMAAVGSLRLAGVNVTRPAAVLFGVGRPLLTFPGVASAALQLTAPNEFRGQVTVLFWFIVTLIGHGLGPSLPAALTDFVFADDSKVGWFIALTMGIGAPIAAMLLWLGRAPMRRAIKQAEAWAPTSKTSPSGNMSRQRA